MDILLVNYFYNLYSGIIFFLFQSFSAVQQKVERLESEEKSNEAAEYFLNVLLEYSEKKKEHESKAMWSLFDEALKSGMIASVFLIFSFCSQSISNP